MLSLTQQSLLPGVLADLVRYFHRLLPLLQRSSVDASTCGCSNTCLGGVHRCFPASRGTCPSYAASERTGFSNIFSTQLDVPPSTSAIFLRTKGAPS